MRYVAFCLILAGCFLIGDSHISIVVAGILIALGGLLTWGST